MSGNPPKHSNDSTVVVGQSPAQIRETNAGINNELDKLSHTDYDAKGNVVISKNQHSGVMVDDVEQYPQVTVDKLKIRAGLLGVAGDSQVVDSDKLYRYLKANGITDATFETGKDGVNLNSEAGKTLISSIYNYQHPGAQQTQSNDIADNSKQKSSSKTANVSDTHVNSSKTAVGGKNQTAKTDDKSETSKTYPWTDDQAKAMDNAYKQARYGQDDFQYIQAKLGKEVPDINNGKDASFVMFSEIYHKRDALAAKAQVMTGDKDVKGFDDLVKKTDILDPKSPYYETAKKLYDASVKQFVKSEIDLKNDIKLHPEKHQAEIQDGEDKFLKTQTAATLKADYSKMLRKEFGPGDDGVKALYMERMIATYGNGEVYDKFKKDVSKGEVGTDYDDLKIIERQQKEAREAKKSLQSGNTEQTTDNSQQTQTSSNTQKPDVKTLAQNSKISLGDHVANSMKDSTMSNVSSTASTTVMSKDKSVAIQNSGTVAVKQ